MRPRDLRDFTMARVALGRAGNSLPTRELLDFQLAHARARDAVHFALDTEVMRRDLEAAGWKTVRVHSAAKDRSEYLRRPDLGRLLNPESQERLREVRGPFETVFVVGDGLSALAAHRHAVGLLASFKNCAAPVIIASEARVALSDEIGAALAADLVVMLIGERPGLGAPDSLGAYLTWAPGRGRTDAERNCISNIRPEGMSTEAASGLLTMLMDAARARRISGVTLSAELAARGIIEST
jgi:ethanolamine ammonia-lyase small subunit